MKNLKVDFTISTGRQYENVHVSAETDEEDGMNECLILGKQAEEKFHNCFIEKDITENAGVQVEQKPVKGGSEKEVTFEKEQNE